MVVMRQSRSGSGTNRGNRDGDLCGGDGGDDLCAYEDICGGDGGDDNVVVVVVPIGICDGDLRSVTDAQDADVANSRRVVVIQSP